MAAIPVDRRTFLRTSAAGLPLILPGMAWARRSRANEQIPIGIIGMGIRARNLMNGYLLGHDRLRILAVCDVDRTRREHYQKVVHDRDGNTDCAAYIDYQELLARDDIAAVVITTPDHWHATMAIHAAAAGKDIYCEKPLTHTLEEGRRIIAAIRKHQRVFQTGSQQRSEYSHRFIQAVEAIRNGRIGKLLTAHVGVAGPPRPCDLPAEELEPGLEWDRWLGPAPLRRYHSDLSPRGVHGHYPSWRAWWEYSGGYQADMGAHHFDIAQWALDADRSGPIEVHPPRDGDPERGVSLVYENGARVIHGGPSGVTFVGTEGTIQVDRGRLSSVPGEILSEPLPDDAKFLPHPDTHVNDWIRCIDSRADPVCDVEIGARTAAVCQLINLCYRSGRSLRWDPAAWSFRDDPEADTWLDYQRRSAFGLPQA